MIVDTMRSPTLRRTSIKLKKLLMQGALKSFASTPTGTYIQWMVDNVAAEDCMYTGAPVRCEGRVMGSLCCMFVGPHKSDDTKDKLIRAASRLSAVLDAM